MKVVRRFRNGILVEFIKDGVAQPIDLTKNSQSTVIILKGPGLELQKLLNKFGLKPKAGCKCTQRINEMNLKGVEWCEQNIDTIISWLKEEAQRANLLFTNIGARIIVKRAIKNSKKRN